MGVPAALIPPGLPSKRRHPVGVPWLLPPCSETWPFFRPNFTNMEALREEAGAEQARGGVLLLSAAALLRLWSAALPVFVICHSLALSVWCRWWALYRRVGFMR